MADANDEIGRAIADVLAMSREIDAASKAEHDAFIEDGRRRLNAIADLVMADAEVRWSVRTRADARHAEESK